ncbi:1401_t:CDS:2, partial [Scutellospora calospora]
CESYSLNEFINRDEPLQLIKDFDLLQEKNNSITVASSTNAKKISLHISTTGIMLKNIAQVAIFTELV